MDDDSNKRLDMGEFKEGTISAAHLKMLGKKHLKVSVNCQWLYKTILVVKSAMTRSPKPFIGRVVIF